MYSCHANQSRDHTRICSARGGAAVRDYHQKSAEQASVGNRRNRLSAKLQSGPIVPQGRCVILNHPTVPDEWLLGSYPWTQFPVVFWTYSGVLVQVPFTGQEQIRVGLTRRVWLSSCCAGENPCIGEPFLQKELVTPPSQLSLTVGNAVLFTPFGGHLPKFDLLEPIPVVPQIVFGE